MHHHPVPDPDWPQDAGGRGHRHQVQAPGPGHRRKQRHQLPGECVSPYFIFINTLTPSATGLLISNWLQPRHPDP